MHFAHEDHDDIGMRKAQNQPSKPHDNTQDCAAAVSIETSPLLDDLSQASAILVVFFQAFFYLTGGGE